VFRAAQEAHIGINRWGEDRRGRTDGLWGRRGHVEMGVGEGEGGSCAPCNRSPFEWTILRPRSRERNPRGYAAPIRPLSNRFDSGEVSCPAHSNRHKSPDTILSIVISRQKIYMKSTETSQNLAGEKRRGWPTSTMRTAAGRSLFLSQSPHRLNCLLPPHFSDYIRSKNIKAHL